jgi:BirA family biotin operon repressor/biotin-[acetyl-CoA-carboxylase] ligase
MEIITLIKQMAEMGSADKSKDLESALNELSIDYRVSDERLVLTDPLELLDEEKLLSGLSIDAVASLSQLEVLWTTGSTNTHLLARSKQSGFHGSVCTSERQTAGKGRRGRKWISPFARNIYVSFGWSIPKTEMVEALSLYIGMNLVDCLRGAGLEDVEMKWPNDVIVGGGKLAGILIELDLAADKAHVVIGVGVNLSLGLDARADIGQPVSVVSDQKRVGRNELCSSIIDQMLVSLRGFTRQQVSKKLSEWSMYDCLQGAEVEVHLGSERIVGINRGVDERGNLLVEVGSEVQSFSSGEVSLRRSSVAK